MKLNVFKGVKWEMTFSFKLGHFTSERRKPLSFRSSFHFLRVMRIEIPWHLLLLGPYGSHITHKIT